MASNKAPMSAARLNAPMDKTISISFNVPSKPAAIPRVIFNGLSTPIEILFRRTDGLSVKLSNSIGNAMELTLFTLISPKLNCSAPVVLNSEISASTLEPISVLLLPPNSNSVLGNCINPGTPDCDFVKDSMTNSFILGNPFAPTSLKRSRIKS